MKRLNRIFFLMVVLGGMLVSPSCTKDDEGVFNYPRLFAPIQLSAYARYDITAGGMATVSWLKRDSAVSYTLELYQDSMKFLPENLLSRRLLSANQDTAIFLNLVASTTYSVRLKANAADDSKDSKFNEVAFKVPAENIFIYGVNPDSITDVSAWMRWFGGPRPVTKLTYKAAGGSTQTHDLTPAEQSASLAELISLDKGKVYTVTAYNGDVKRGATTFRTADVYLTGGGTFTERIDEIPDGGILAMGEGTYTTSATKMLLDRSITIKGISGGKTILQANTSAAFKLPALAPDKEVRFQNLYIQQGTTTSGNATFIPQDVACSLRKLWFDGCYIQGFTQGLYRTSTVAKKVLDTLVISNCIATLIGASGQNYALIHNSNSTLAADSSLINNIRITNSTIYNTLLGVIQNDYSNASSVTISTCTFHDMVSSTRYFINYGNYSAITLQIDNCVFGATKAASGGIRAGSSTVIAVSNSYKTTDFDDTGANTAEVNYSIPNLAAYSGTSSALFTGPITGPITGAGAVNFSYKDAAFKGKNSVGDPRWR